MVLFHCVFLEFLWNDYFILVCYEFQYSGLREKNPFDIFCILVFFRWEGFFMMIAVYKVEI